MFSFLSKKRMNEEAAKAFWMWFEKEEAWIIDCISKNDSSVIWAVDEKLKLAFPYYSDEIEFQLGFNNEQGEFFFFHDYRKELMKDSEKFGALMTPKIASRWSYIVEA